jgi:hypothetical protein
VLFASPSSVFASNGICAILPYTSERVPCSVVFHCFGNGVQGSGFIQQRPVASSWKQLVGFCSSINRSRRISNFPQGFPRQYGQGSLRDCTHPSGFPKPSTCFIHRSSCFATRNFHFASIECGRVCSNHYPGRTGHVAETPTQLTNL